MWLFKRRDKSCAWKIASDYEMQIAQDANYEYRYFYITI